MGKTKNTTEKISITRALSTLKLQDKRISKAIKNSMFANYKVGGEMKYKEYTPKEDLQSVQDLIKYRSKLKAAIMASNASTKVKIGKTTMTVVEAIEMKDSIKYKKELLSKIISDLKNVERDVTRINDDAKYRLDDMIRASYGGDKKVSSSDYDTIATPFLKKNGAESVDSETFMKIALEMEEEIDTFESEVDLVLSESNSTTFLEV